ncbi:MAG: translocation/assembly module TamB domain-containing protein [Candidatus Wallbacteria bacterium]|nr:translocation/assembly module TamB domain-containing protein [Candidatus Wallbacteria bacterium]
MKRKLKFGLLLLLVLPVILATALWMIGGRRLSAFAFSRFSELMALNYGLHLYGDQTGVSLVKGLFIRNFFVTDQNGRVLIRGKEVRVFPDINRLIKGERMRVRRLFISGAEIFIDAPSGAGNHFQPDQFHLFLEHLIATDLTVNITYKGEIFSVREGFFEAFLAKERIEGLARFSDDSGNRCKVFFYGPETWGVDTDFQITSIRKIPDFLSEAFSPWKVQCTSGSLDGRFRAFYSQSAGWGNCEAGIRLLHVDGNYAGRQFREVDGSLKLAGRSFTVDLEGGYQHSRLGVKGVGVPEQYTLEVKSSKVYLKDFQDALGSSADKLMISGLGSAEVTVAYDHGKVAYQGMLKLGAGEIWRYRVENGIFPFSGNQHSVNINSASFLFGRGWDVCASAEVQFSLSPKLRGGFAAENIAFPALSCSGRISGDDLLIRGSMIFSGMELPFTLDLSKSPSFTGSTESGFLHAKWNGEIMPETREWFALAEYRAEFPQLSGELSGSLHLKRTADFQYEIGRAGISSPFGEGGVSGYFGIRELSLDFGWKGSAGVFKILHRYGLKNTKIIIDGRIRGTPLKPMLKAELQMPDEKTTASVVSADGTLLIEGKHHGSSFSAGWQPETDAWQVGVSSENYILPPKWFVAAIPTGEISFESFKGIINGKGREACLDELMFSLFLKNGQLRGRRFSEAFCSGKWKNGILTADSFSGTLIPCGTVECLEPLVYDSSTGLKKVGLGLSGVKLESDKFSAMLDGRLFYNCDERAKGVFSVRLRSIRYGDVACETLEVSGGLADEEFTLHNLVCSLPLLHGWKGRGRVKITESRIWLGGIELTNGDLGIKGSMDVALSDYQTGDFNLEVKDENRKMTLMSLEKKQDMISGRFALDTGDLKKVAAFDKIPPTFFKGEIVRNRGEIQFQTKFNDNEVKGTGLFELRKKPGKAWNITGEIEVKDSRLSLKTSESLNLDQVNLSPLFFEVDLKVGKNVWIRNSFINAEVTGTFKFTGRNYPGIIVSGDLKFTRGTINYFSHRFDIITGKVYYQALEKSTEKGKPTKDRVIDMKTGRSFDAEYVYQGREHSIVLSRNESFIDGETNIYLNLLASKRIQNYDVYLQVSGPLSGLQLSAYSMPETKQEDLQRMITGGTLGGMASGDSWNDTNFVEALKFNLREQLMGKVGENIARGLELEEFDIEASTDEWQRENLDIKLGKYLSDRIYLRYSKKFRRFDDTEQFEVKYRTNKHLFLEGLYDELQDFRFGMKYSVSF